MSLFIVSTLIPLVALFLPLVFLFKSKWSTYDSKWPPGKLGWPFIGETFANEYKASSLGVQEKFIRSRMQKFSSEIFKTSLFGDSFLVFCSAMGNKMLFSNENKLVRTWHPRSIRIMFRPKSPSASDKIIFRTLILSFSKPEALQKYIGIVDSITKQHLQVNWENKKEVTVAPLTRFYTVQVLSMLTLSFDDPIKLAKFQHLFTVMEYATWCLPISIPGTALYKAIKAKEVLDREISEIVKRRKIDLANKKASPTQDVLSHLLYTGDDEKGEVMSDSYIAGKIVDMLHAGNGSTSNVISYVIKYLAELPHVYNQVFAEHMAILKSKGSGELLNWEDIQKMKYTWNVVCEVMRVSPTSAGGFKEAITEFTHAGHSIPKGCKILWSPYSTHKDPNCFPDPEKFDPSRFEGSGPAPYTFVPFGGGPRMCPGKEYARIKICIFMHNLVTKFKWVHVIPGVDSVEKPMKDLRIRLQPHVF